ncbi:MAG: prolipoprotein diacylglyceryl transferase [Anaerolineales bacterium]
MSVDSLGIHLGPLYLRYYGVILVTGALVGGYVASLEARRRGLDPNFAWDGLIWALIGGIVGARLYHVFTPPPSMVAAGFTTQTYLQEPLRILQVWNGGLGIPGGVAGGVLGFWLYARRVKLDFPVWLDIAAPALPLAQAIGRWGNFVNQELYGRPTNAPWAVFIDPQYRLPEFANVETYHPLFLYESILNLFGALALLWIARKFADRLRKGDLFLLYLILYPAVRFSLEFIRLDSSRLGNLNVNQTLSMLSIIVVTIALLIRHRRRRPTRGGVQAPA